MRAFRFIFLHFAGRLDIFGPAVADQVGYVFEDDHSHPVWNLLVLHGAVMEHIGNDDRLQQTDDH